MGSYNNNNIRRRRVNNMNSNSIDNIPKNLESKYNIDSYNIKNYDYDVDNNKKTLTTVKRERRKKNRLKKRKKFRKKILKCILSIILVLVIIGSLFTAGFIFYAIKDTPKITKELVKSKYVSSEVVNYNQIPNNLKHAIIAIEDQRFYKHGGVDYISLLRSLIHNLTGKGLQGGSTIDMQVSKNMFTSNDKTMKRKIRDIYNAIQLDKIMSKNEILTVYLNNIYLGKKAYGVEKGANVYFAKNVEDLNLPECAMLAGITNNPYKYQIFGDAKKRQEIVLYKMYQLGFITESQYKNAKIADIYFKSDID